MVEGGTVLPVATDDAALAARELEESIEHAREAAEQTGPMVQRAIHLRERVDNTLDRIVVFAPAEILGEGDQ